MVDFNPQSLTGTDRSRFSAYKSNLDFYDGNQWLERSKNRQLVFNYIRIAVDKVTSYLMNGLNFACDPLDSQLLGVNEPGQKSSAPATSTEIARKAEAVIYKVYEENHLQQLDYETEVDTAILGDGCYKVTWDVENKRIRVTSPDMNGIYAWWVGDDIGRVWRVASRYQLSQEDVEMLYSRKVDKKSVTITELWTARDFLLYMDTDIVEKKANPYGFIPFILFPGRQRLRMRNTKRSSAWLLSSS